MPDIKSILCPIDFSDASRHALEHAIAIARWYNAGIVGLHVFNPVEFGSVVIGAPTSVGEDVTFGANIAQMQEEVLACLEPARAAGVKTAGRVESGPAADAILDDARVLPADIIVMGTHGASGFEHLVLGSVTEKVLRKAVCPVLTVPPRTFATSRVPFRRLLCPVDFSEPSIAALEFALSIAQESDAELTVLHVLEWQPDDEPLPNLPFSVPEYGRHREGDALERLARLIPESARTWCAPAPRITHGKPYREILGAATEDRADLIIMGVHGRNAFDIMLFGSTTNQVVRRATCPVLTLRR